MSRERLLSIMEGSRREPGMPPPRGRPIVPAGNATGKHAVPICPAEPSIFPEDLLEQGVAAPSARRWWAIYTKARQEKSLRGSCSSGRSPSSAAGRQGEPDSRQRIRSYIPLFAGYVFLFVSDEERLRALTTNRISRTLPIADEELLREDLRQIRRLIEAGAPLTIERRLSPGRRVRVKAGSMMGLEGTVLSRRGGNRLLVAVNFLQQGASVALDDFMVEPLD